jgi:hypothetical protein
MGFVAFCGQGCGIRKQIKMEERRKEEKEGKNMAGKKKIIEE